MHVYIDLRTGTQVYESAPYVLPAPVWKLPRSVDSGWKA